MKYRHAILAAAALLALTTACDSASPCPADALSEVSDTSSRLCPIGMVEIGGECGVMPCETSMDCPAESMCREGECYQRQCLDSRDCASGQECYDYLCIDG